MPVIRYLKELALLGAIDSPIKISSSEFTKYTSSSSKTAARILKQLEDEGFIDRQIVPGGQMVSITDRGIEHLRKEYADYQRIFSSKAESIELHGRVITGLGEGQYYVVQEGYSTQFEDKLDFIPFPGTLNVRLNDLSSAMRERMDVVHSIPILGFKDGQRTFGGGKCYPVSIEGIKGAIVVPERSHYPEDLLEIIAPINLREKLGLKDGDVVRVVVESHHKGD